MGSRVAVRVRPLLLPCGGARSQAALGRVPARKFFAKETLQLPKASSLTAGLGAGAARRRRDARDGGSSLVIEVGGVGGVVAAHGGLHLAGLGGTQARGQLRRKRQIVARVVIEARGQRPGVRRGRRGPRALAGHPRSDLAQGAGRWVIGLVLRVGAPAAGGIEDSQITSIVGEIAQSMLERGRIGVGR